MRETEREREREQRKNRLKKSFVRNESLAFGAKCIFVIISYRNHRGQSSVLVWQSWRQAMPAPRIWPVPNSSNRSTILRSDFQIGDHRCDRCRAMNNWVRPKTKWPIAIDKSNTRCLHLDPVATRSKIQIVLEEENEGEKENERKKNRTKQKRNDFFVRQQQCEFGLKWVSECMWCWCAKRYKEAKWNKQKRKKKMCFDDDT